MLMRDTLLFKIDFSGDSYETKLYNRMQESLHGSAQGALEKQGRSRYQPTLLHRRRKR